MEDTQQLLEALIEGRNDFLSNDTIRRLPFDQRASVMTRFMTNELAYITLIQRLHNERFQYQAFATLLATPMMAPVVVAPSRAQLISSLEDHPHTTSNCAICQDAISSHGCRIRQCGHVYHRSCIENWFSMSVRCPVCRFDIREEGPQVQTSADATQMPPPMANPSEGQTM